MDRSKTYFPAIATRQAEMRALSRLAGPTKDLLLPLVHLQAWPRVKSTDAGYVQRSIAELGAAFGDRKVLLDVASARFDRDSEGATVGREEVLALHNPTGGFTAYVDLVKSSPNFIPVLQWSEDKAALHAEIEALAALNRGLVVRLKKSRGWHLKQIDLLEEVSLAGVRILVVVDCEQISLQEDLTILATGAQNAMLYAKPRLKSSDIHFTVLGSSFPSSFSDIHPKTAKLDIRERQVFSLLRGSAPLLREGIDLQYGDHASVFAAERAPSFKGLPRVDYPAPHRWIYHRRPVSEGFGAAATAIVNEDDWDRSLLCWGAQEIRRAATGDLTGLNAASPWTAVRINVHLHQQAHFAAGGAAAIEEAWTD